MTIPTRGINILVPGDTGSGKSWLAGALVERLHQQHYAVCVIDPEGDYRVLGGLPGVIWLEIDDHASLEQAIARFEHDTTACVVLDLSALPHPQKIRLIEATLDLARIFRQRTGRPHWIVLDEAHYSLHRHGVAETAIGLEQKGFCLVTHKPSWLRPAVLREIDTFVLARTTAPEELSFLRKMPVGAGKRGQRATEVLPDLPSGEFVLIQPGDASDATTFSPAPRQTAHVRHLHKYADSQVPPDQRFFFRGPDGHIVTAADSLNAFREAVGTVPEEILAHHAARGDFSRWVLDVFSDRMLCHQIRKLEGRWTRGEIRDLRPMLQRLVAHRYGTEG